MQDFFDQRMSQNLILLPVFVQVLLTFAVLVVMGVRRQHSAKMRGKTAQDLALAREQDWERPAIQASNNFKNQFELPVLFYTAAAFALITRNVDMAMFILAWVFVLARIGHAVVHLGSNVVLWRGSIWLIGFIALVAMWVMLALRLVRSGF